MRSSTFELGLTSFHVSGQFVIEQSVIGQLDKLITIINTSFFPFMGPALLGKFPRYYHSLKL